MEIQGEIKRKIVDFKYIIGKFFMFVLFLHLLGSTTVNT